MYGHRGIWADGWKAVTYHPPGKPFESDRWELYHLDEDFSECRDLALAKPEKLKEMVELWWSEAGQYGVLPLDDRSRELWSIPPRAGTPRNRRRFVFYPPIGHMTGEVSPPLGNRSFTASAEIVRASATTEGALFALGTRNNGMAFYVLKDRLIFDYNLFTKHHKAVSNIPVPVGASTVAVSFEKVGERGRATVLINDVACGNVEVPTVLRMISSAGMDAGRDAGSSVSDDYEPPFDFQGQIKRLVIELPERSRRAEAEAQTAQMKTDMSRQ
jgi:arylsulfatase